MHVLVATDGNLDIDRTITFVGPLARDGSVSVLTVTEVPRRLLNDLRTDYGQQEAPTVATDVEYVGASVGAVAPAASYPGDDAIIEQYLRNRETEICVPLVERLSEAGVATTAHSLEGENAAATIVEFIRSNAVDIVVVGSHGSGRFEGLLGSTGVKVTRQSPVPVLVMRHEED